MTAQALLNSLTGPTRTRYDKANSGDKVVVFSGLSTAAMQEIQHVADNNGCHAYVSAFATLTVEVE